MFVFVLVLVRSSASVSYYYRWVLCLCLCWCVAVRWQRQRPRGSNAATALNPSASFAQVAESPFYDFAIKFPLCLLFPLISKVLESTLHKFLYSNTFSGLEDMVFFSSQFPWLQKRHQKKFFGDEYWLWHEDKGSLQNKFSVKVGNLAQPAWPPPPRTLGFFPWICRKFSAK